MQVKKINPEHFVDSDPVVNVALLNTCIHDIDVLIIMFHTGTF